MKRKKQELITINIQKQQLKEKSFIAIPISKDFERIIEPPDTKSTTPTIKKFDHQPIQNQKSEADPMQVEILNKSVPKLFNSTSSTQNIVKPLKKTIAKKSQQKKETHPSQMEITRKNSKEKRVYVDVVEPQTGKASKNEDAISYSTFKNREREKRNQATEIPITFFAPPKPPEKEEKRSTSSHMSLKFILNEPQ